MIYKKLHSTLNIYYYFICKLKINIVILHHQKRKTLTDMTTIAEIKDLKITFNGVSNYYVAYHYEGGETQTLTMTNTERKARNFFNKVAKAVGYVK